MVEKHADVGEENDIDFDRSQKVGEHLETERQKEVFTQSKPAYDEDHFGEHCIHLC